MERNNRRKFLAAGLGIIGAAASGMIAYPLFKFLVPRKEAGQKTRVEISAADVPEGGAKFFEFDGLSAVLVRKKGGRWLHFPQSVLISAVSYSGRRTKRDFSVPVTPDSTPPMAR